MLLVMLQFSCQDGYENRGSIKTSDDQLTPRNLEKVEITNITVEGCCVYYEVRTNVGPIGGVPHHIIDITKSRTGQVVFTAQEWAYNMTYDPTNSSLPYYWTGGYCFEEDGTYCIEPRISGLQLYGNGVDPQNIQCFDIIGCKPDIFGDYLCWEDFALQMREVNGIVVSYHNVEQSIGFDPPIFIVGGYQALVDATMNGLYDLSNPAWSGNFAMYDEKVDQCLKGNGILPGLFFYHSNYKFVRIVGKDENDAIRTVNFKPFSY